jgi:hypothetical protein
VSRRAVAAVTAALLLAGCHTAHPARHTPTPGDPKQAASAVRAGHLRIQVLTARCGIFVLSGTHALLDADGEFCRARIRVTSADSSSHDFSPYAQLLVLADGREIAPSNGGMAVRRQPDVVTLGADDLAEVVVIWDIPHGAAVTGVRCRGDADPDAAGAFVTKAVNPAGVLMPLTGLRPKA